MTNSKAKWFQTRVRGQLLNIRSEQEDNQLYKASHRGVEAFGYSVESSINELIWRLGL